MTIIYCISYQGSWLPQRTESLPWSLLIYIKDLYTVVLYGKSLYTCTLFNDSKNKKYNSNNSSKIQNKNVERGQIDTPNTQVFPFLHGLVQTFQ
jgi:hypothetical protein